MHIDVPWGFVAGKWYGSEKQRPIMMVHGWLDNAGSFDTLIPFLPPQYSYLSIDLPGHGRSSHLPRGCYYHSIDYTLILELIRKHFKWDRVSLVSHSMGSIVSFNYAYLLPDNVNLVCALDTLKPFCLKKQRESAFSGGNLQKLLTLDEQSLDNPSTFSYDEIIERDCNNSELSINKDRAKYIVDRHIKPSSLDPNQFYYSRDVRIKYIQLQFGDHNMSLNCIKRIKAPYLFIRGDDQYFSETGNLITETVEAFRKHDERFEFLKVTGGTHHLHLNQPEFIADKLSTFLRKYHEPL